MQTNHTVCEKPNGNNTYRCKIGNNIIILKEHFENKATIEHLIENVIRYDWNNSEN